MRSVFLRIFLWFWLAMAVVAAVLVVTSPFFTRSRPGVETWRREAEEWTRERVDRIADRIEEAGIERLPMGRGPGPGRGRGADGRGGPPPTPGRIFVVDDRGGVVVGGEASDDVLEIARRSLADGREMSERSGALYLTARPVTGPDGRRLVVVAANHQPPRLVHLLEPKALAWRLGVLFLVVGGLSFWLARYLSAPVRPLRSATRRLSGGDLGARVEGGVSRRRDELGELARDFDAMAERIEGLVGSQQRLLRDVSHELRSPLARLVVALELARARAGEAAQGPLDRIAREAGRLDELIGQLLLLARLEAGGDRGATEDVDLVELLSDVVADAGYEAVPGRAEIRFAPTGGWRITGRPGLLRSAFDNVLRNALHHTPDGTPVEVELRRADGAIGIVVRDRGAGVPDGELDRIFEPFHRVDDARDRSLGGTGIGLAIARRAIEAHGGRIEARNHPDGGLEVTLRLPEADAP